MARRKVDKGQNKEACNVRRGLKMLVYGKSGSGKSTFTSTFKNSYILDSEQGSYSGQDIIVDGKKYNECIFVEDATDIDSLQDALQDLIDGNDELEEVQTLIIDSETKFYNIIEAGADAVIEKRAKASGKTVESLNLQKWGLVKKVTTQLSLSRIACSSRGIHVVSVCQAKEKVDKDGNVVEITPAANKDLKYDYDVILYFEPKKDENGKLIYGAKVLKDRTGTFEVGTRIDNPIADMWLKNIDENAKTLNIDYSASINNATDQLIEEAERAKIVAKEIVALVKNIEDKTPIKEYVKEKGIKMSVLEDEDIRVLEALKKFIKEL